jgi:hypothetical protein
LRTGEKHGILQDVTVILLGREKATSEEGCEAHQVVKMAGRDYSPDLPAASCLLLFLIHQHGKLRHAQIRTPIRDQRELFQGHL